MRSRLFSVALLILASDPAHAGKVLNPYPYLENRIDQASGSTELDSLFHSIVVGELLSQENGIFKESTLELSNDEKGSLITLLYLKGLQNDWITPELTNQWDSALEKNKSMFSRSSKSLAACFHSLKTYEQGSLQQPDCDRLSTSVDPSKSFLDTCALIAPIINASTANPSGSTSLITQAGAALAGRAEKLRATENSALGMNTKPSQKCEKIADAPKSKPLGEFIRYLDENRSESADDAH